MLARRLTISMTAGCSALLGGASLLPSTAASGSERGRRWPTDGPLPLDFLNYQVSVDVLGQDEATVQKND